MPRRSAHSLLFSFWLFFLGALLFTTPSQAGERADAQAKKKEGDRLFAEGDYEGALRAYEEGAALYRDASFDLAKGQTLVKLRRYAEAKEAYQVFLASGKAGKRKGEVKRAILELEKILSTTLSCTSSPEGASVYLDSRVDGVVGKTPLTLHLAPGIHRVIVELEGFSPHVETVDIPEGTEKSLNISLSRRPLTLDLSSTPEGAEVFVDGESRGKTPLRLEVPEGSYQVELALEGYERRSERLSGTWGETFSLQVELTELPGELLLTLSPPWAEAEIAGYPAVKGSGSLSLPPGRYEVVVRAGGHTEATAEVVVARGEKTPLQVDLVAWGGVLEVSANTEQARVFIDGKEESASGMLELTPGSHNLRVEAPGFSSYEERFDIKSGERLFAKVILRKPRSKMTLGLLGGAGAAGLLALANSITSQVRVKRANSPEGVEEDARGALRAAVQADIFAALALGLGAWGGSRFLKEGKSEGHLSPGGGGAP